MIKDITKRNETVTANAREIGALQAFFPACFDKEGNFDLAKFQDLLKDKVSLKREGYGLNFLGKNYARMLASLDSTTVVVPDEEHNNKPENKDSENIYITGDNLDGLKQLLHSYSGKIKCIYIDPPYNTGSDGFVYNDKFTFTAEDLAAKLSIDEDEAERILKLTKKGSASHSAWLMFMYPRLMLARDMLRDDGVIFISIDDNEQANLKLLCDDVFGEQNFVGTISVENNPKGRKNSSFISVSSEYCVVYARNINQSYFVENIPKNASDMIMDENGRYVHNSGKRVLVGENSFNEYVKSVSSDKNYVVYYKKEGNSIEILKEKFDESNQALLGSGYNRYCSHNGGKLVENTYSVDKFLELFHASALEFSTDKIYEKNYSDTVRIKSQIVNREYEAIVKGKKKKFSLELTTTGAGTYLKELFSTDELIFDAPKNCGFLKLLISLIDDKNMVILDFFSGSSTTAHAVMQLNAEDEGNRKYIMVQLAEPVKPGSEAEKAGYTTIDEIGRKRIELAAAKIKAEHPDTKADLGYKHFTLAEPSQETLDKLEKFVPEAEDGLDTMLNNDIFHAFGLQTVLATWLLRDGYGLTARPEAVDFAGYTGYYIGRHLYLIEEGMTDEAVTAIVEKYDSDKEFQADNLVVFGYNFAWTKLQALRDNLIRLKDTEKNLRVMFDVRY